MTVIGIMCIVMSLLFIAPSRAEGGPKQKPDLRRALAYLDQLDTLKADFVQEAPEGRELTGVFYLDRPGKLRFDYDAPVEDYIVADGTFIYFYDAEMDQQSNAPIGSTMADYILRENPGLDEDITVHNIDRDKEMVNITLKRADESNAGQITLGFSRDPYRLRQWRVIDARGAETVTRLKNIKSGIELDPGLFVYRNQERDKPVYNE